MALDISALQLKPVANGELNGSCPFCGDRKKHFYLNPHKGVYRCFKCGASGRVDGASHYVPMAPLQREEPLADDDTLDRVYNILLRALHLSREHREQLMSSRRGLSAQAIEQNQYKTLPPKDRIGIAGRVAEWVEPRGVPGFYLYTGRHGRQLWCLAGPSGLLIPMRDFDGRIRGCQIRPDRQIGARYVWLSSANPRRGSNGTGARAVYHVARAADSKTVWLTEGPLKADIAASRMGKTFVAVPGVNCWKGSRVVEDLLANGVQAVVIAYDSDSVANEHVARAATELGRALQKSGIRVSYAWWPPAKAKGIDDLLLLNAGPRVVNEKAWLRLLKSRGGRVPG
ncbi:MAG: DUF3854 domain-containing protein [Firmicutes bacterium]|jgi:hypothetical protein|nr:DUF3854 domain-containing protein [Bacillota bacterium]